MNTSLPDAVLINDWHPVGITAQLAPDAIKPAQLLDIPLVIWRDQNGRVNAWEYRCPHRGMKLSMGTIQDDCLVCPYHGWTFGSDAKCKRIPALPNLPEDNLKARAKVFLVEECYGLIWVCVGSPSQAVPAFPEFADERLRKVWCGPYDVLSSGPRIIENFLDMAHFAYVHEGILGDKGHNAIADYDVETLDDAEYGNGIRATKCRAWQPRSNSLASSGSNVEYTYRVVRPLTAILTKEPQTQQDFREAISLHLQPMAETSTRAWIILAMTNFEQSDDELRAFQDTIFLQDKPIVENQQPLRLPLAAGAEVSAVCDKMSLAYRRYLKQHGLRYGVVTAEEPTRTHYHED
jgi:phenylpropionate dioxygenase-like ring-hydroxylating dioxygenase large terminal subunit